MKLVDAINAYEDYTRKLSENVRYYSLAGLAFVWVLGGQHLQGLSRQLLGVCLLLVITLALDFVHYLVSARRWGGVVHKNESKGVDRDQKIEVPLGFNRVLERLWAAKIIAMAVSYLSLIVVIAFRLF